VEKRINTWCNRWISQGGRLVLVKIVLEAIPVFWMSMAWIPKGVLEVIRKLCYRYIWSGDNEKRGFSLASWKKLAIPKENGGWGLKNPFLFSKALATKNVWRLIQGIGLWVQVIKSKYIALDIVEEWVRKPIK
jgi:hypothetical protein